MNPALLTLLVASGVALCALLIVASGLIHTSLKRRRAVAAGGPDISSRILDDLRPMEDLLVDFVRRSPHLTNLLLILSGLDSSASFARIVHEIRIERNASTDPGSTAHLVVPTLFILGLAGLIRVIAGGFVITEVGREVLSRIESASPSAGRTVQAVLVKEETQPATAGREERNQLIHHTVVVAKGTNIMKTNKRNIIMTAADHAELEAVIRFTGKVSERTLVELSALAGELKRAAIVEPEEIPSDVITMNSRAELLDLESKERMQFMLVLPRDARIEEGKISVLAPLGTAMLGYRVGDEFQWRVPYGVRRLKVTDVYFQPEAHYLKKAA